MDRKEQAKDLFFKGLACVDSGEFENAERLFFETLNLASRSVPTLNNLAIAQYKQNKIGDAAITAQKVIEIEPDNKDALFMLSACQKDQKHYEEAIKTCQKIVAIDPTIAEAHNNLGYALKQTGQYREAAESFERAIDLEPKFADAFLNRGNAFHSLKRYDEAFSSYDQALTIKPDLAEAWLGRGNASNDLRREDDALTAYDRALKIDPEMADAYWSKSLAKLCGENFEEGWDLYEWRSKIKENISYYPYLKSINTSFRQDRSALKGKKIAILAEQGIGDEIMFASILPDLISDAKTIFYEADPRLTRIFERAFPAVNIVPRGNRDYLNENEFDVVLQAGSLGYVYRRGRESFPRVPYLSAEPTRINKWKSMLADAAGSRTKIGLSWRGGTLDTRRDDRSLEIEQLRSLAQNEKGFFVSLQYGNVTDELAKYNNMSAGAVHCLFNDYNNFDDFAALIMALDLVISVQNTTVHMCGALGKTCWGMIPWRPEWRYGNSANSMIWYSSVALFRQQAPDDWDGVINSIKSNLANFAGK